MLISEPIKIEGDIPRNLPVKNGQRFLFISRDQQALTHGIHKYPAKFFPELPRWIIERYSKKGDLILDPFMGSGTVNLEASILGRNSLGVDVDPFSQFIAKVKTTVLPERELLRAYCNIEKKAQHYSKSSHLHSVPDFPYRDNWFKPGILKELAYLKASIKKLDTSPEIKDFFLVCFSSIIRRVSEADNNCTRTVIRKKLNKQVKAGAAINLFLKRIEKQTANMLELASIQPTGTVFIPNNMSALNLSALKPKSFDLALTSPPYLNAVDYPRTHQLEMYWLGMASGSLRDLKRQHVGTEVVRVEEYKTFRKTGGSRADRLIKKIYHKDPRRACIASKYILDMAENLKQVYRVLKKHSFYVIVIGNNQVRGFEFETWRYLQELAVEAGYKVKSHFISVIINHFIKVPRKERINDDYILILQK